MPKDIIKIKNIDEFSKLTGEETPRYDFIRGEEGEVIADLIDLRGIEDLGDRIRVLPGTKWRDVINFSPEIFGNLDFSVGGDVHFNEPVFGFNEFGEIRNRVEVEAIINGKSYTGKYVGGIIKSIIIRKEIKNIIYMKKDISINEFIDTIDSWFSKTIPVFRDIRAFKNGEKVTLLVAYPEFRKGLLKKYIEDFKDSNVIYEEFNIPHRYFYSGYVELNSLKDIVNSLNRAEHWSMRIGRRKIYITIFSNTPLSIPFTYLSPYCNIEDQSFGMDCIGCGRCVNICPHYDQVKLRAYSPLGFYFLSSIGMGNEVSRCHMCGLCNTVCPVKLDIVGTLKSVLKINGEKEVKYKLNLKLPKVIVITPLSQNFILRAIKAMLYLRRRGIRVGIITLNIPVEDMIKGNLSDENVIKELNGIDEIITITPEEYNYLSFLKTKKIIEISYIEDYVIKEFRDKIRGLQIHEPCFLGSEKNFPKAIKACSHSFLDFINSEDNIQQVKADITLCPFTALVSKIPTFLDKAVQMENFEEYAEKALESIISSVKNYESVILDIEWYKDLDDTIYSMVIKDIMWSKVKSLGDEFIIPLYFYLSINPQLEMPEITIVKNIIEEYLSSKY
ncbi:MAG: 4Fe-4S dicluster domain-containing protein [Sulfolobaceae archaeon]